MQPCRSLLVLLLSTLFAISAHAAPPIPLSAFFGPEEIGSVALSPSGRTLALTVPGKNQRMELVATDLDQRPLRFRSLAWLTDYDIAGAKWLNDGRLVFQAYDSQALDWVGITGLWAVDADGGNGQMLIDPHWGGFRARVAGNRNILPAEWTLHSVPGDGSDEVLVVERGWSSFRESLSTTLARLDTHVPRPVKLTSGAPDGAQHWFTDGAGRPQVVQTFLAGRRQVFRLGADGRDWIEIGSFARPGLAGWWPRFIVNDHLYVAAEAPGERGTRLREWDAATAAPAAQAVLAADGFDVGDNAAPIVDLKRQQLLGWRWRTETVVTRWTDPAMARMQAAIDRALPDHVNLIDCAQACGSARRWLVTSYSDRDPPSYSFFDREKAELTGIGAAHPDIPAGAMGSRRFERIHARDGGDLPLYLTLPKQTTAAAAPTAPAGSAASSAPAPGAAPRPAVVYVHGGPQSRVGLEWTHDAVPQFLASRGYVVIEPEFRGSAGYGIAHQQSGWHQWGLAMQDDILDALQWAVAQGLVDPGRVCIMGASYGGYAALIGAARDATVFRCAIAWVAPTDLPALVDHWRSELGDTNEVVRELDMAIGRPQDLRETSPVNRVDQVRVPLLAAWGVADRRIPIAQGRRFRDAARAAKVDLEYVEYADEGHVWMKPATRIDFFGRAEKLLARTLGAAP